MREDTERRVVGAPGRRRVARALGLADLLKKADIEARYSQTYRITHAELSNWQDRALELARRGREACLEKLATFAAPTPSVRP